MSSPVSDADLELRRKKRVLAALVVHDLRSPLSAASGYLELVGEELANKPDLEQARGYIDDCTQLITKALSLVSCILDVDELEDGILRARAAQCRLAPLVAGALATCRASFEMRDLRTELKFDPDLEFSADKDLFGRILENLVDNATRYAPRGGKIVIGAVASADAIEIFVGNDGPAVPENEREAIFGRYYQVEARRASARANRGLGLYFCRLAAEAHGGSMLVEERGELRTVFSVRLPQPIPDASVAAAS